MQREQENERSKEALVKLLKEAGGAEHGKGGAASLTVNVSTVTLLHCPYKDTILQPGKLSPLVQSF